MLAAWGGGAVLGGIAAYRLVQRHDGLRLGALAWVLQALPLWLLAASPPAAAAIAALASRASATACGCRRSPP